LIAVEGATQDQETIQLIAPGGSTDVTIFAFCELVV
jgi:hypothetical protein